MTTIHSTQRLEEPLLKHDNSRFIQLPYKYPELQKAYDVQESSFWTAKEIDYSAWNARTVTMDDGPLFEIVDTLYHDPNSFT